MALIGGPSGRTSPRARACLAILVAGYLAMAVVAGAPNSPLTVLLPAGARPPSWATGLATVTGIARIGRPGLIGVSWILLLAVLAAFVAVLAEARAGRVGLRAVLGASGISLAIAVAAPLLLSRDVYTYAAYGRIETLYRRNPYTVRLSSFAHDPFVAVASVQWLRTHSLYGPAFTLLSAAVARACAGSPTATILAFKLLSGVAVATATGLVAVSAARARPGRAPFAVALIGLNPVLVIHTVGGGHVDALIAAPLAAAMAIAVIRPRGASLRAVSVTVLLTAACLVKAVVVPALVLWVWWVVHTRPERRGPVLAAHLAAIGVPVAASVAPFLAGWHTLAPFATFGGVEAWASPSQLVGRTARTVVGSLAGPNAGVHAATLVEAGFLALFVVLAWQLARRSLDPHAGAPTEAWGAALLLLALCMPFLLPWYAAWFAPFLGMFADEVFLAAGALVTGVLAMTLIPADPFHGFSTRGVMDGVHYGAASVLLLVLVALAARILRSGAGTGDRSNDPAPSRQDHEVGGALLR